MRKPDRDAENDSENKGAKNGQSKATQGKKVAGADGLNQSGGLQTAFQSASVGTNSGTNSGANTGNSSATHAVEQAGLSTGYETLANASGNPFSGDDAGSERVPDKQLDNNLSTKLSTAPGVHRDLGSVRAEPGQRESDSRNLRKLTMDTTPERASSSKKYRTTSGTKSSTIESASNSGTRNIKENTALHQCVEEELDKYFALLEGQAPNDLYRLVISQVETALFGYVLELCGNNQSKAAEYLGVSRGTLRNRIVDLSLD